MTAALADLGTSGHWVPCDICPFDFAHLNQTILVLKGQLFIHSSLILPFLTSVNTLSPLTTCVVCPYAIFDGL
jgi:hypothetical protein